MKLCCILCHIEKIIKPIDEQIRWDICPNCLKKLTVPQDKDRLVKARVIRY